jgi:hypothetical protein
MPWWVWVLVGLGLVSFLAAIGITFRSQVVFAVRFAKILMTDRRVPRPLRWLIRVSLAIKVVPVPDFGVDEAVLVGVGLVLVIFYRPVLVAMLEEARTAPPSELVPWLAAADRSQSAMRLNRFGRLAMNNPFRERLLVGYVATRLYSLDPTPARRTLVVGCGQGVDIDIAQRRFGATEVVAIDLDPVQVSRARRRVDGRPAIEIFVGDVVDLRFDDATFDTVFELGAIHLVPEWRRAYAEISRVLRPGGKFRFETIVAHPVRHLMALATE